MGYAQSRPLENYNKILKIAKISYRKKKESGAGY
jgi:hypothetical protein